MTIYRIEKDGLGPYRSKFMATIGKDIFNEMMESHDSDKKHPCMGTCIGDTNYFGCYTQHLICGCQSLKGLLDWFEGYTEHLLSVGFNIIKYECPRDYCCTGEFDQVVFDKTKSSKLSIIII